MGIKSPQNIQLINHRAFWERRLRLLQVDFDALENGFVSSSGNLSARRRAILVWRSTGTVQELLDNFRPLVKDVLKPIGTGWIVSQIPAIKCG